MFAKTYMYAKSLKQMGYKKAETLEYVFQLLLTAGDGT